MCWSNFRKQRISFVVVFFLCLGGYQVLHKKMLQNQDIKKRLDKLKPTVPVGLYDEIKALRWKVVQQNFRSMLLQRELLYAHQTILKKEILSDELQVKSLGKKLLSLTSVVKFLPHLQQPDDRNIKPKRVISKHREKAVSVSYGLAINNVADLKRLVKTLRSLFRNLQPNDKTDIIFILYIHVGRLTDFVILTMQKNFARELDSGIFDVIVPPWNYYPSFQDLGLKFGNSKNTTVANAKQNLDMVFLMMYARTKAAFYVQLGTDLTAVENYATKIRNFAIKKASSKDEWFELSFTTQGCVGKLYRSDDIIKLVPFFLMNYKYKPCDWILFGLVGSIACNPEKSVCAQEIRKRRKQYRPVLFLNPSPAVITLKELN